MAFSKCRARMAKPVSRQNKLATVTIVVQMPGKTGQTRASHQSQ